MMKKQQIIITFILILFWCSNSLYARHAPTADSLSKKESGLITIAATAGNGDLTKLKDAINKGLDAGLTSNQIKESLIHLYAYAGFPRSIRGLQTLMSVLEERKAKGINDPTGADASPIPNENPKYERGKAILEQLTGVPEKEPKTGYSAFAPTIEIFLKEHLFADIFERNILTYAERELVTISILASIGGVEPMLKSHLTICLNIALSEEKLQQFISTIESAVGKTQAVEAQKIVDEVLANRK